MRVWNDVFLYIQYAVALAEMALVERASSSADERVDGMTGCWQSICGDEDEV